MKRKGKGRKGDNKVDKEMRKKERKLIKGTGKERKWKEMTENKGKEIKGNEGE